MPLDMNEPLIDMEETLPQYFNWGTDVIEYVARMEVVPVRRIHRHRSFSYPYETMSIPRHFYSLWYQFYRIDETYQKLKSLIDSGIIDEKTMIEIMKQKVFLEDNIHQVLGHRGYVVVSNEQFFFGSTLDEAIRKAKETVGDRPFHSETIDFIDYPTPFS